MVEVNGLRDIREIKLIGLNIELDMQYEGKKGVKNNF